MSEETGLCGVVDCELVAVESAELSRHSDSFRRVEVCRWHGKQIRRGYAHAYKAGAIRSGELPAGAVERA